MGFWLSDNALDESRKFTENNELKVIKSKSPMYLAFVLLRQVLMSTLNYVIRNNKTIGSVGEKILF